MTEDIKKISKTGIWTQFALIFVAIIFNTNTSSFVVIISDISQSFKSQGITSTQVSMLQTLPTLLMIPGILFSGWLLTRISKKWIIVSGWAFYGLCGLLLFFVQDYRVFLLVRALMGLGLGLVNPQSRSMIAQIYSGEKVASTIGYVSMFGGLVSFSISICMGYIAANNWRLGLLVFPVFAVVAVTLALAFIPTIPPEPKKAAIQEDGKPEPYGKFVWAMWISGLFIFMLASVIQIKTSIMVKELGVGDTTVTGWVSAATSAGTFFGGFLFGFWHKRLKRWTFPVAAIWAASGYLIFCTAHTIPQLLIGGFIAANGSIGTLNPYLISRVSLATPPSRKSMAITIMTIGNFFGQFLGTYFIVIIEKVVGTSASMAFSSTAFGFIFVGICGFIFVLITKKSNEELMQKLKNLSHK